MWLSRIGTERGKKKRGGGGLMSSVHSLLAAEGDKRKGRAFTSSNVCINVPTAIHFLPITNVSAADMSRDNAV